MEGHPALPRALLELGALLLLGGALARRLGQGAGLWRVGGWTGLLLLALGSGLDLLELQEALDLPLPALLAGRPGLLLALRLLGGGLGLLPSLPLQALGALLLLYTFPASAHPADRGGVWEGVGLLHAGAGLLWAGGVVYLALAPETPALRRLSRLAPLLLLLALPTGVLLALPVLQDPKGPYAVALGRKLLFLVLALLLALWNRRALRRGKAPRALFLEALALLGLLAATAALATTHP